MSARDTTHGAGGGVPAPHGHIAKTASRTRRPHGFIGLGATTAVVHSTRRADKTQGVTVTVGTDALQLTGAMTPTQARSLAKALLAAADAVERAHGRSA